MTRAAEVNRIQRRKFLRAENGWCRGRTFIAIHLGYMLGSRAVASLASDTQVRMVGVEFARNSGCRRVAAKTSMRCLTVDDIAESLLEAGWSNGRVTSSDSQYHQARIVGDPALKVFAITLQHISLGDLTRSKRPINRRRYRPGVVLDEQPARACSRRKRVAIT